MKEVLWIMLVLLFMAVSCFFSGHQTGFYRGKMEAQSERYERTLELSDGMMTELQDIISGNGYRKT